MLTYSFTNKGTKSLYEHLYKCVKNDILSENILPGDKLPSKRNFAKNLGVSIITVENAYMQLQAEGYIYSIPKKGYYVNKINCKPFFPKAQHSYNHSVEEEKSYFVDLVSTKTIPELFPFSIWAKLMRETIKDKSFELMIPSPNGGIIELRSAISNYLHQFRNMNIRPEQVIVGAGTEYLYSLIIQLLGFDKIYALEDPGYKKLAKIYKSNNVTCKYITMDAEGVSIKSLEDTDANILHISPAHHFPTGITTTISRRYELLRWASKKENRYIIEDDFDSEFRMEGKPIPMLQSIDLSEKVIYMNTFSKSLTSTIRVSYMVLPLHLTKLFNERLSFYNCTVSTFEQHTLAAFIEEGYFEKHINRMRNYYKNLRNKLLQIIQKSPLYSIATISEEDAGLHFLMRINTKLSDEEIKKSASRKNIHIACLSDYQLSDEKIDTRTLIMNYSALSEDHLEKFIQNLSDIFVDSI